MQDVLDRLDVLAEDRSAWGLKLTRHIADVGNLRISIDVSDVGGANWQVEDLDEERVVSNGWKPEASVRAAMKESTDFARAVLLSQANPQHVEA